MPRRKKSGKSAKQTRRKFPLERKAEILAEIDAAPRGTKGAVVEKHGLHSAMIAEWRKKVRKSGVARKPATASRAGGISHTADFIDLVKENSALRAEVATLRSAMEQVKRFVSIQRQLAGELLGTN
ncbi:MAG: transposase [Planctomycetota bacterium]